MPKPPEPATGHHSYGAGPTYHSMGVVTRMTAVPNFARITLIFLLSANHEAGVQIYGREIADQGPPRDTSDEKAIRGTGATADVGGEPHTDSESLPPTQWGFPTRGITRIHARWHRGDWRAGQRTANGERPEGTEHTGGESQGRPGAEGMAAEGGGGPETRQGQVQKGWAATYPDHIGLSPAGRAARETYKVSDMQTVHVPEAKAPSAPGLGDGVAAWAGGAGGMLYCTLPYAGQDALSDAEPTARRGRGVSGGSQAAWGRTGKGSGVPGSSSSPGPPPPSTTLPSPTGSHRWWCDTEDEDDIPRRGEREKSSAPRLDGLEG